MIKLFRKIRLGALTEYKFGKYMIYATGEIILVVIGILIALQINTWNEQRKIKAMELAALKEIASDLRDDLTSLENDVRINQSGLTSITIIREALKTNRAYHDSLSRHFGKLDFNTTYTLKTSGFDHLKNLGFHIIENDSIRKKITDLYAMEYPFLKEREQLAEQKTFEYFSPRYLRYFKRLIAADNALSRTAHYEPVNYDAMRSDQEFQRLLDLINLLKEDNKFSINYTLKELKLTQALIHDYIGTLTAE